MKLLICSDIHGDATSVNNIMQIFEQEKAEKLLILGDILYHGPRNELPQGYKPKEVIKILNENKDKILAIRGNCDTEVDQMVLDFPILAEYAYINIDGISIFVTHGHKFSTENTPPLSKGEILLHGHTHIPTCIQFGNDNYYLNPGSVSIPKNGYPKSYMIYENRVFKVKDFNGNVLFENVF